MDVSRESVGVMYVSNISDECGGFFMYVLEYYVGEVVLLIVVLYGGSGYGCSFLWIWL